MSSASDSFVGSATCDLDMDELSTTAATTITTTATTTTTTTVGSTSKKRKLLSRIRRRFKSPRSRGADVEEIDAIDEEGKPERKGENGGKEKEKKDAEPDGGDHATMKKKPKKKERSQSRYALKSTVRIRRTPFFSTRSAVTRA